MRIRAILGLVRMTILTPLIVRVLFMGIRWKHVLLWMMMMWMLWMMLMWVL